VGEVTLGLMPWRSLEDQGVQEQRKEKRSCSRILLLLSLCALLDNA
jgi:hypothetical protein